MLHQLDRCGCLEDGDLRWEIQHNMQIHWEEGQEVAIRFHRAVIWRYQRAWPTGPLDQTERGMCQIHNQAESQRIHALFRLSAQASAEYLRLRSAWDSVGLPSASEADKDRKWQTHRGTGQEKVGPALEATVQGCYASWIWLRALLQASFQRWLQTGWVHKTELFQRVIESWFRNSKSA